MKVGILIDEFAHGSAPVISIQEAKNLKDLGISAKILVGIKITSTEDLSFPCNDIYRDFLINKYPAFVKFFNFRFPFFSFFSPQHLLSIFFSHWAIKDKEYDCIVAHGIFSALIAWNIRNKRKIPFFTFFWDPSSYILRKIYPKSFLGKFFFLLIPLTKYIDILISKKTDQLILGSRFHLDWFRKYGIEDIKIIYPGCFPIQSIPLRRGDFVLTVDRWDIGSLPNILLEVLQNSKVKFKLKVVGYWQDDLLKTRFLDKRKELHLDDFVEVLGPMSIQQLRELYLEARCLVHPTKEGFGMTALEAASYGCPFIFPAGSGVTDLFKHGRDCFLVQNAENSFEYLKYIELLLSDQEIAWEMGRWAWEVAKKYTWKYHAEQLANYIKDFLR